MYPEEDFLIEDADDLPEIHPPRTADAILTAPPKESVTGISMFSSESFGEAGDTIEGSRDIIEKSMVRALLRVMNSTTARESDIIKAVGESAELLGKKGKGTVNIIKSENAQINNIMEQPELMQHIKKAAEGIKKVSGAKDARIKTHRGGQGT